MKKINMQITEKMGGPIQSKFAAAVVKGFTANTEKYVQAVQERSHGSLSRHIRNQWRIENILNDFRRFCLSDVLV